MLDKATDATLNRCIATSLNDMETRCRRKSLGHMDNVVCWGCSKLSEKHNDALRDKP